MFVQNLIIILDHDLLPVLSQFLGNTYQLFLAKCSDLQNMSVDYSTFDVLE